MSETPRRYSAEELRKLADTLSQESSVTTELSPVELEDEVSKALYSASEDAARLEQIATWADEHCRCCGDPECQLGHDPCTACQLRKFLSSSAGRREASE